MHYPTEEQVRNAIDAIRERGEQVTDVAVATEIGARCGVTPGADVVASLVRHYGLGPRFLHGDESRRAQLIELFRVALLRHHADDWSMEICAQAAHICAAVVVESEG